MAASMSVCLSVRQKPQINGSVVLGADESPWPCGTPSWYTPLSWMILSKQKNLHLFSSQYICVFSLKRPSIRLSVSVYMPFCPIVLNLWMFESSNLKHHDKVITGHPGFPQGLENLEKIKFSGKVMELGKIIKGHGKVMELRISHTDKSPPSIRNFALISLATHLVSYIHSNTSDYELLGEFEANPLVYCYWFYANYAL